MIDNDLKKNEKYYFIFIYTDKLIIIKIYIIYHITLTLKYNYDFYLAT